MDVDDDILVVTIDAPGAAGEHAQSRAGRRIRGVFRARQDDPLIKGVVLISGKPEGFIAGADIEQFPELEDRGRRRSDQPDGAGYARRLEQLRVPVVARFTARVSAAGSS